MPTLRVLGTTVTLREDIRQRAQVELGFDIEYQVCDLQTAQRRAVLEPESYDIYDQWFHDLDFAWPTNVLQPIEVSRLSNWDSVNSLARLGALPGACRECTGSAPVDKLYVQSNGRLAAHPTDTISMLPLTHNADSFIYDQDQLPKPLNEEAESWAWLVSPAWKGRVGLQSDASIGGMDARMALSAAGLARFADLSNPSLSEIDLFAQKFSELRAAGYFKRFWADDAEGSLLLRDAGVSIQTIWASSSLELNASPRRYKVAEPKEGYRGWAGGMALSRSLRGQGLDRGYAYLNWWLGGWPGAYLSREGFYTFAEQPARGFLSEDEWSYWYAGRPTQSPLYGNDQRLIAGAGARRPGGSYTERVGNIAVWVGIMDEHNYFVRKWDDALATR